LIWGCGIALVLIMIAVGAYLYVGHTISDFYEHERFRDNPNFREISD
jgi:hypothetical protein